MIVPCGINVNVSDEDKNNLMDACRSYEKLMSAAGIRVKGIQWLLSTEMFYDMLKLTFFQAIIEIITVLDGNSIIGN